MTNTGDEAEVQVVVGGGAVVWIICPNCGYGWIAVAAVKRSWGCPKCGHLRSEETLAYLCRCAHAYGQHRFTRERSWKKGDCRECDCSTYEPVVVRPKQQWPR